MRKIIFFEIIFVLLFLFVSATLLYPQSNVDVDRATRETGRFQGQQQLLEKKIEGPPAKAEARPKPKETRPLKEEEQIFIRKIKLVGCESFSPEEFSPVIKEYENQKLTLDDLRALSKEIEQEYIRRGVIAAVVVPPQQVEDETVILQVVEIKMGKLQIQYHPYYNNKRLKYYWDIYPGEVLHYDKLSRSLQLMSRNPDREVKSVLRAGKKPGTTDVILVTKTDLPIHFFTTIDNEGVISTGHNRINSGFRHNNFLGLDDTMLAGYIMGKDFSGQYAYHSIPVTGKGMSFVYGYSQSRSAPKKGYAPSLIRSRAKNISASLHQELYKQDKYTGEVFAGFESKDKTIKMDTGVYNRDRLRVFSAGGNFLERGPGSYTYISPTLTQGVDFFGASSRGNPLASRGADSVYTKFNLDVQHKRILAGSLQASLKFKAQASSTKLTPQEAFGLGGSDTIRGYPRDDYLADQAVMNQAELVIPSFFIPPSWRIPYAEDTLRNQATLVGFADIGYGRRRGALPSEKKSVTFASVGAGIRMNMFNQATLRLEWGFPLGDRPITEHGKTQFHFSFDFQEKLPEEIERIRKILEEEHIKEWSYRLVDKELSRPDSPLRKKIYAYLYLARNYLKQGKIRASTDMYEKLNQLSESLYQQSAAFVREYLSHEKMLTEYKRLAVIRHKEGSPEESRRFWQKIIDESGVPAPRLTLEY